MSHPDWEYDNDQLVSRQFRMWANLRIEKPESSYIEPEKITLDDFMRDPWLENYQMLPKIIKMLERRAGFVCTCDVFTDAGGTNKK